MTPARDDLLLWWQHTSQYEGRGHWLHCNQLLTVHKKLSPTQWQANLDLQLLRLSSCIIKGANESLHVNVANMDSHMLNAAFREVDSLGHWLVSHPCHCCFKRVNLLTNPYHCLGCTGFQRNFIHRHQALAKSFKAALLEASSGLKGKRIEVSLEPALHMLTSSTTDIAGGSGEENKENDGDTPNPESRPENLKRGDLLIQLITEASTDRRGNHYPESKLNFVIDIAACSPLAKSYRTSGQMRGSAEQTYAASATVENIKLRKYRNEIAQLEDALFYPIVFNLSGTPGLRFFSLLADQLQLPDDTVYNIAGQLAVVCACFNARTIEEYYRPITRQKFQPHQQQPSF